MTTSATARCARPRVRLVAAAVTVACLAGCSDVTAPAGEPGESVVVRWDVAALQAVRATRLGPPMVARARAITHTAVYDAWAAYDARAGGTRLGAELRHPAAERTGAPSARR